MTEQEEREQIKAKIIEDIDYLKKNENEIRTALVKIFPNSQDAMSVDIALNTLKMNGISYLDTGTLETLKTFYTNIINQFTIVSRAFLSDISNKNSQNKLIESAKGFNEFTNSISIKDTSKETNFQLKHDAGAGLSQEFDKLYLRINNLETKPDEIMQALNSNLNRSKDLIDKAGELSRQSEQTLEGILQFKQETVEQNEKLVTKLENTINQKISVLLSDQLEKKSFRLLLETIAKFLFFVITIIMLFIFNKSFLELYLNISTLPIAPQIYPALSKMEFWHFIVLKLSMNIPLFIIVGFTMNEYSKSKKLYEEYEFRKISAITLFNNYERLTKDLGMEKEDLMESLKSSLDKIFDNPVHSIYGDKSGDKNIGLDQFEKFANIFGKIKSKE